MNIAESNPFWVPLPDGTIVDIATKEGVHAYLNGVSTFHDFSSNLKQIRKLRKKKQLNARDDKHLRGLVNFITSIAIYADRETFRAKIPESEIQDWLNYVIEELKNLTRKPSWVNSGKLDKRDEHIFLSFTSWFGGGHLLLVQLAFKCDFYQVLANSIKVLKRVLPHFFYCGLVGVVAQGSLEAARHSSDDCWTTEKIFKKFEASGLLEQMLRCSTVSTPTEYSKLVVYLRQVLEDFQVCAGLLSSKLKVGTPCGNTLKAILDGRDGGRNVPPQVLNQLKNISRLAEAMDPTEIKICVFNHCQNCADSEAQLFSCSRCCLAHYCSQECQLTDWKNHKGGCRSFSTPEKNTKLSLRAATWRFLKRNAETVFEEIEKKCDSSGLEASDLAVVVDFTPGEDSIIQGLQDPPVFRVFERALFCNLLMIEPHAIAPTCASMVLLYGGLAHFEDTMIETFRQGGYRQGLKLEDYLCDKVQVFRSCFNGTWSTLA